MIRIVYDDRERFPWVLWIGSYLWAKYRTRKGALNGKRRLMKAFEAYEQLKGNQ